jgi:hypothetical protein
MEDSKTLTMIKMSGGEYFFRYALVWNLREKPEIARTIEGELSDDGGYILGMCYGSDRIDSIGGPQIYSRREAEQLARDLLWDNARLMANYLSFRGTLVDETQ